MPRIKKEIRPFRDLHPDLATAVEDLLEARKSLDNLTASLAVLVQRIQDEPKEEKGFHSTEELLTVDEVAKKIKIRPKSIYNLVCRNSIPYCKVGGSVRFVEDDIKAWAKERGNYDTKGV